MKKVHAEWTAALGQDRKAVAAKHRHLRAGMKWKSCGWGVENWEVLFEPVQETLPDFIDDLADFVVRHEVARSSDAVRLYGADVAKNREAVALLAIELGIATQSAVITPCDTLIIQGKSYFGDVVLYDPRDRVRPGTIITHEPVGEDLDHQPVGQRLQLPNTAAAASDHPDDIEWAMQRAGTYRPPVPLRKLLEEWAASHGAVGEPG